MAEKRDYSAITPEILALAAHCSEECVIDKQLYAKYKVNRGLRDENGNGVLTGLTEISEIQAKTPDGQPCDGSLFYRGYNIHDLVKGFLKDGRFGFEEITYLLLFGELPSAKELEDFRTLLASYRSLPNSFVRDIIMKAPSTDIMNSVARSVLTLYSYDNNPNDTSIPNVLRQCLQLIAMFPQLALYGYQAYNYYKNDHPVFFIHDPVPELSTAQNILHMLRPDMKFTDTEARVLDMALVLHAEHGGGNNSSFTTHVVTSSGTDTYSAIAAALGSLKGPKHGGANIKVCHMFDEIKEQVGDWADDDEVRAYLTKILHGEAFDHAGLIYGVGHAVYSLSDPRAVIFKSFVHQLAQEKGMSDQLDLIESVERLTPQVFAQETGHEKMLCANVDLYSGFVYQMLDIPEELFTPLFATARMVGWCAHRLEEVYTPGNKIIRPAYKAVAPKRPFVPLAQRK